LTITQGLAGSVSENCLGRRDAADGGAAAAVVDGVAEADGDFVAPAAEEADADGDALTEPPAEADEVADPDGSGDALPEAEAV
jgi:hypothetical protein